VDAWLGTELGEGWAPEVQQFIQRSMEEIPALDFSTAAAQKVAAAVAGTERQQEGQQAGGGAEADAAARQGQA